MKDRRCWEWRWPWDLGGGGGGTPGESWSLEEGSWESGRGGPGGKTSTTSQLVARGGSLLPNPNPNPVACGKGSGFALGFGVRVWCSGSGFQGGFSRWEEGRVGFSSGEGGVRRTSCGHFIPVP